MEIPAIAGDIADDLGVEAVDQENQRAQNADHDCRRRCGFR